MRRAPFPLQVPSVPTIHAPNIKTLHQVLQKLLYFFSEFARSKLSLEVVNMSKIKLKPKRVRVPQQTGILKLEPISPKKPQSWFARDIVDSTGQMGRPVHEIQRVKEKARIQHSQRKAKAHIIHRRLRFI